MVTSLLIVSISWLTALATFSSILAFCIGPVIQGTLRTGSAIGIATLPRCEDTQDGEDRQFGTSGAMFDQYEASIYLSAFGPSGASDETLQALNTNCNTGNCEWPVFSSLALCSNTTDIKSQVIEGRDPDGTLRNLTLPNGLSISSEAGDMAWAGSSTLPTMNYNNWNYDPVARFSVMYFHLDDYSAAEGVMYWCIQAYDAKVKNAILESNITTSWYPKELNTSMVPMILSPPEELWNDLGLTNATDFKIGNFSHRGIPQIHLDFINESMDLNKTEYNELHAITELAVPNFPEFFAYLAGAMTNRFRGSVCTLTVEGEMILPPVLKVQWLFLLLPIVTTLLVCVFLASVILESRRHNVRVWKTNILVPLFHGLSEDLRLQHRRGIAMDVRSMENKAKNLLVCLKTSGRDGDGLLLRQY